MNLICHNVVLAFQNVQFFIALYNYGKCDLFYPRLLLVKWFDITIASLIFEMF